MVSGSMAIGAGTQTGLGWRQSKRVRNSLMLFERDEMRERLGELANRGVYVGTSSWKFPDWCGILYDEERYLYRNKFSKARFERECLSEYADVFRSVCVDATYYRYPKRAYLEDLAEQAPDGFKLSFKVPDDITIKTFPDLDAFGSRAGQVNADFLNEDMCRFGFLRMLEPMRDKVGVVIFEFSHFHKDDFEHGRDFVAALDQFFGKMPDGWQFGVEVRNANLLHPDYFAMLANHGVAHVYNHWTHMPSIEEQLTIQPASNQPFVAARLLLTPGDPHVSARERMQPYSRILQIDPSARTALQQLLNDGEQSDEPSFIYIGNELEGSALHTIADAVERYLGSER